MDYIESLPEEMQSTAEICQLPPAKDGNITDEEHVDEDNLDEVTPEDVCSELDVTVMHDDYESDSESIDTLPVEKTSWKRSTCFSSDLGEEKPLALHETASELISLSPTELFHKILPVEKIEDFADKSQNEPDKSQIQKGVNFEVHVEVLMQFFGLILLRSYHSVPNENHFWSTADDVCVSIVPRVMARNKFENVKRYFHLVDNSKLKKDDLMGNIKLLYDYLNQKLLQFGVSQEKLSTDESMGGVDTMDMLLSSYRPKIRSRKWWWNLFNNALNIAVVAAWRLHCELHDADRSAMTHLAFRRDITAHLLRARPLQISRPGLRIHLPRSLRSSRGHFLQSISTPTGSQFGHSTVKTVCYDGPFCDDARLRHGDATGVLELECRPSTVGGSVGV
ncbi:PiggyBac transposable element-derived protein 3 [Trichinella patagoniensis]|uniref:PiggyBac transposable element-derived protein 3 n=1 Tax=Trichinella patagoniensis TaxID=990121 RepID=A0A0V0ZQE4_9BILA|nr:PiggyBac transposable element-derived protein 3 [Trichinella patagoniensis]